MGNSGNLSRMPYGQHYALEKEWVTNYFVLKDKVARPSKIEGISLPQIFYYKKRIKAKIEKRFNMKIDIDERKLSESAKQI